jgi:hypothetical protein
VERAFAEIKDAHARGSMFGPEKAAFLAAVRRLHQAAADFRQLL